MNCSGHPTSPPLNSEENPGLTTAEQYTAAGVHTSEPKPAKAYMTMTPTLTDPALSHLLPIPGMETSFWLDQPWLVSAEKQAALEKDQWTMRRKYCFNALSYRRALTGDGKGWEWSCAKATRSSAKHRLQRKGKMSGIETVVTSKELETRPALDWTDPESSGAELKSIRFLIGTWDSPEIYHDRRHDDETYVAPDGVKVTVGSLVTTARDICSVDPARSTKDDPVDWSAKFRSVTAPFKAELW